MKMYSIEIDEGVWSYLQKHAEPFVDTPNTVLNRLLLGAGKKTNKSADVTESPAISIKGTPKSLAQILEVIYEMEINGYSRIEATNRVAAKSARKPMKSTNCWPSRVMGRLKRF